MFLFIVKEAFRSNKRAKLSFLFSLLSTTVGLVLIAWALLSIKIGNSLELFLRSQFEIQVYLKEGLHDQDIELLKSDLGNFVGITSVHFVSKDDAAKKFVSETGDDFRKILDYNPLPASFVLKTSQLPDFNIDKVKKQISLLPGVDEVVFPDSIFRKMLAYLKVFQKYVFLLGCLLSLVAFYVIFATTRLIIASRHEEIETMKLVGGSLSSIKFPLLLNGVFIGLISSGFALIAVYGVELLLRRYLWSNLPGMLSSSFILLLVGPALGFISSLIASWKISLKL